MTEREKKLAADVRTWLTACTLGPPNARLVAVQLCTLDSLEDYAVWAATLVAVANEHGGQARVRVRAVPHQKVRLVYDGCAIYLPQEGGAELQLHITGPNRPATEEDLQALTDEVWA